MKYAGRYASLLLLLLSILVAASSLALAQIGPDIPREETLIVDILTGRSPNPPAVQCLGARHHYRCRHTAADAGYPLVCRVCPG